MTDRPIVFSTPMVQAILRELAEPGTGKTQTRRMITPQPEFNPISGYYHVHSRLGGVMMVAEADVAREQLDYLTPPWEPGDRAWVREGLKRVGMDPVSGRRVDPADSHIGGYAADDSELIHNGMHSGWLWKRSALGGRYMPRWANRITLHITDVRVMRLQDTSREDCRAEGHPRGGPDLSHLSASEAQAVHDDAARDWYMDLWDDLHGVGAWASNPWVYALTFVPELAHIDNARSGNAQL